MAGNGIFDAPGVQVPTKAGPATVCERGMVASLKDTWAHQPPVAFRSGCGMQLHGTRWLLEVPARLVGPLGSIQSGLDAVVEPGPIEVDATREEDLDILYGFEAL